jgi:phosphatidylglycerophosphate synthase
MSSDSKAVQGKPVEIEGLLDLYFYTPLGKLLMLAFRRTPVTPNGVSWLSVAAAAAAAAFFFRGSLDDVLVGALLFILSGVLDSTDGQLARATGQATELGETLDGFCDSLSFGLIYLAAALGFVLHHGGSPLVIAPLALAAAASHSIQSALVDYERQLFLFYVTGCGRVTREDPVRLAQDIDEARRRGEGWWSLTLRRMRLGYCRRQQGWLRSSVELLDAWRLQVAHSPSARARFAERYRAATRPLLQAWTVVAPNSHTLGILACALAPFVAPGRPFLDLGLALVFLFDIALNIPLALLIVVQRRTDHRLLAALQAPRPDQSDMAVGAPTT